MGTAPVQMRLLVVDDDPEVGETTLISLRRRKVDAAVVRTAQDALDRLNAETFDAAVVDIRLVGEKNGIELLRQIRETMPDFPVIILTAYGDRESAIEAVRLGAQDFILKPLDGIEDLLVPVQKAVEHHRLKLSNQRLQGSLRKAESDLASILGSLEDLVFVFDAEGRIQLHWAPPSVKLYTSPKQFTGRKASEVLPAHVSAMIADSIEQNRRGQTADFNYSLEIDGRTEHWHAKVSPITSGEEYRGSVAVCRDVTRRRQLEQEVLDVSERERARLGYELHDVLAQHITAVAFMSAILSKRLRQKAPDEAELADRINKGLREAVEQARRMAKGLGTMVFDSPDLKTGLRRLCGNTEGLFGISCELTADCAEPVTNRTQAGHLYHIAGEAVSNAVRHGRATRIRIDLNVNNGSGVLAIRNNGKLPPEKWDSGETGMGVQIMFYRAGMISGSLKLDKEEGSVRVMCSFTNKK